MAGGRQVLQCGYREWEDYFSTLYPNEGEAWDGKPKPARAKAAAKLPAAKSLQYAMKNMDKMVGTPVYCIYFYFKYHETYESKSDLEVAMEYLGRAGIRDWAKTREEDWGKYQKILGKHYNYISMKWRIKKMEEKL